MIRTKKLFIIVGLLFLSQKSTKCMEANKGNDNNLGKTTSHKENYLNEKIKLEEKKNSAFTIATTTTIQTSIQIIGMWIDRGASYAADNLRRTYFGLTEEEEAKKIVRAEEIKTAIATTHAAIANTELTEKQKEVKMTEQRLYTLQEFNSEWDFGRKLCREGGLSDKECRPMLNATIAKFKEFQSKNQ